MNEAEHPQRRKMELNNNLEIIVEIIPIVSFKNNKHIIKLPDSAYGEWLIYKSNVPIYYLNIFDPIYKKMKDWIDLNETSVANIIGIINKKIPVNPEARMKSKTE